MDILRFLMAFAYATMLSFLLHDSASAETDWGKYEALGCFSEKEFKHPNKMQTKFLDFLCDLDLEIKEVADSKGLSHLGWKIRITSDYREPSRHPLGIAVDFYYLNYTGKHCMDTLLLLVQYYVVVESLNNLGYDNQVGLGLYAKKKIIHIDFPSTPPRRWGQINRGSRYLGIHLVQLHLETQVLICRNKGAYDSP